MFNTSILFLSNQALDISGSVDKPSRQFNVSTMDTLAMKDGSTTEPFLIPVFASSTSTEPFQTPVAASPTATVPFIPPIIGASGATRIVPWTQYAVPILQSMDLILGAVFSGSFALIPGLVSNPSNSPPLGLGAPDDTSHHSFHEDESMHRTQSMAGKVLDVTLGGMVIAGVALSVYLYHKGKKRGTRERKEMAETNVGMQSTYTKNSSPAKDDVIFGL